MDKETARIVSDAALQSGALLNAALSRIVEHCTAEEIARYRFAVAQIIGSLGIDLTHDEHLPTTVAGGKRNGWSALSVTWAGYQGLAEIRLGLQRLIRRPIGMAFTNGIAIAGLMRKISGLY